jgi:heme oxygenase
VFLTFESLFADLAANYPASAATPGSPPGSPKLNSPALGALLVDPYSERPEAQPRNEALQAALGSLLPPNLLRSATLHTDLTALHRTSPVTLSVALSRFPSPAVQSFANHIRVAATDKPHVLVAYAWVFYMALFSGGRWIRAQLVNAGPDFWQNKDSGAIGTDGSHLDDEFERVDGVNDEAGDEALKRPLDEAGLSFLFFGGESDGEDIKSEFKARLAAVESLFSTEEREEVVAEAREIFRRCIELVRELDGIMGTPADVLEAGTRKDMRAVEEAHKQLELQRQSSAAKTGLGISTEAGPSGRGWQTSRLLKTAGNIGTAVVLSSATWMAIQYIKGASKDGWWGAVMPLVP